VEKISLYINEHLVQVRKMFNVKKRRDNGKILSVIFVEKKAN